MADPVNTDIERAFSMIGGPLTISDDNAALIAGSQAQATPARGQIFVVTQSVVQGAVTLPSLSGGDAPAIMVIVNESPNTIRVGCPAAQPGIPPGSTAADTLNGTATNAAFSAGIMSVTTKSSAVFIASQSPFGKRGVTSAALNNWHGALFT